MPACSRRPSTSPAPALIVLIVPEGGDAKTLRRALSDVSLPNAVVQEVEGRGVGR